MYIGAFYSIEWIRRNILKQSEEEIAEMDKQIEKEGDKIQEVRQLILGGGLPMDQGGFDMSGGAVPGAEEDQFGGPGAFTAPQEEPIDTREL